MGKPREDNSVLAELYRKHRVRVYRTALAILKSQALAEEAAQEVWLRAAQNRAGCGAEDMERQLPVMARNAAIDVLRRESRCGPLPEDWEPPWANDPEEAAASRALRDKLRGLPAEYRDILELKYLWGLNNREIARRLGLKESTVATRAARGRERLREELRKEGYDL